VRVEQIFAQGGWDNFNYLVISGNQECLVVDPLDVGAVIAMVEQSGCRVKAIINTHGHFDHIKGNQALKKRFSAPVWAHPKSCNWGEQVDYYLEDGEIISLAGEQDGIKVIHTPGHTMDHISLLVPLQGGKEALVCGDTLFNGGVGNCHNGGNPNTLFETVRDIISPLPDSVEVLPGHNYLLSNLAFTLSLEPTNQMAQQMLDQGDDKIVTTIGLEREINLFLRLDNLDIKGVDGGTLEGRELFLSLREQRNHW
jgi:hydroxyacylglutathione hydrolase